MATLQVAPMPRTKADLQRHLTSLEGHGILFSGGVPTSRDDLMWQHLEAHIGPIANHRHEWGSEEVRPA